MPMGTQHTLSVLGVGLVMGMLSLVNDKPLICRSTSWFEKGYVWYLVFMVSLTEFRVPKGVSMRGLSERFNEEGETFPRCGWHHPTVWGSRQNKKETVSWWTPTVISLSTSQLCVRCDQRVVHLTLPMPGFSRDRLLPRKSRGKLKSLFPPVA